MSKDPHSNLGPDFPERGKRSMPCPGMLYKRGSDQLLYKRGSDQRVISFAPQWADSGESHSAGTLPC